MEKSESECRERLKERGKRIYKGNKGGYNARLLLVVAVVVRRDVGYREEEIGRSFGQSVAVVVVVKLGRSSSSKK